MFHHKTASQDLHVTSLLHLLQIVIQQNAQLKKQIEDEMQHHHSCTDTLTQIRTPLTTIRTSANIIQRYHERLSCEKRDEHLSNIDSQVAVISDLLDQLNRINSHHRHANSK